MKQSGEGISRRRNAATSTDRSSRSRGVAEKMSEIRHRTAKHCQDVESKKTEGQPCKKNIYCFKEKSSSKNPERARVRWSSEDDEMLTQMVKEHGLNNWQTVARAFPDRNALQCRMRWKNTLDPAVNKEAWSEEEELRLIRAQQLYGNKWLKMVKHFPGRTNYALKEHWRGPMKRKLDTYLASGLLEQVPDLPDDISAPDISQPDTPKDNADLSEIKQMLPALSARPKSKEMCSDQGENADYSGECYDVTYVKGCADSSKVSERIIARSNQLATARKKLDFLSTPVELKACTAVANSQSSGPKMEKMSPITENISPSDVFQDDPPNVPSEFEDTVLAAATDNDSKDVRSSESVAPEPASLDMDESGLDLLDMSYCDDLMMDLSMFPRGDGFI